MKQYKTTIISLIVIAVVVVGFFIVSAILDDGKTDPDPSATSDPVTSEKVFPVESVSDIVLYECNIVDNLVLERDQSNTWTCPTYSNLTLNNSGINTSLDSLRQIMAVVVYEGEITDELIKNYEISQTQHIKFKLSNGSEYTLQFGMKKPGTASYFALVKENNKIYVVNDSYKSAITLTKEDLLHTKIFNFSDSGKIKNFAIYKSEAEYASLTAEFTDGGRTWTMRYPLERPGADTHIEEVLTAVLSVYTDAYIEGDCQDLSKYGLDHPSYTLKLADNKGTQSMILGNKVPEGNAYYCLFGGENNVFSVSIESLTFIDDPIIKYMNPAIYQRSYTELKKITVDITCGEIQESFTMGFDVWEDGEQLYFNGNPIADDKTINKAFRKMHTALYSIELTGLTPEPETKGERLIRILYEASDGTTKLVECFRRDETTMSIYEDGKYTGGFEYIWQITASSDNYGVAGTLENFRTLSGMK